MTELARVVEPRDQVAALVEAWVAGRRSANTRDAYRRDVTLWLAYCAATGLDPLDVWPGNVSMWLAELAHRSESGATRARRLGAVSSWYGWLVRHQAAARNPAAALDRDERPVRDSRPTPALSNDQAAALCAAADADSLRAAAIVYLLIFTGIRVGEMLGADVADVGLDRGHPVLYVKGKGGKARTRGLVPPVFARLDGYLSTRPDGPRGELVTLDAAGAGRARPLIATAKGNRLDRKAIRILLRRLARAAGLPDALVDALCPHSARATYITSALDAGVPVRDVQYAVGHASPVTTEGYDRSTLSPDRDPAYRLLSLIRPGTRHAGPTSGNAAQSHT